MEVTVDETWHEQPAGQVDDVRVGDRPGRLEGGDALAFD